jgi:hypothetical protein
MMKFKISDLYHLDKVDEAPELAGLYVWYGRLSVGSADWDEGETKSNAIAQVQLLRALRDHSVKHRQQPLQLEATANFSTKWSGGLESAFPEGWGDGPEGFLTGEADHSVVRATSSNPDREELLALLNNAMPVFSSPLYIGLAIDQTLRSRLRQHRSKLRRHWDSVSEDPDYPTRIKPDNFSDRAIKMGFSPRDLYFYTLHIETEGDENAKVQNKELLRSAEWLLNRWANPILGRK